MRLHATAKGSARERGRSSNDNARLSLSPPAEPLLLLRPMHPDDRRPPPPSRSALHVFGLLRRHPGCMRPGPLLRWSNLEPDDLAAAINELVERSWVTVRWRPTGGPLPDGLPERFRAVKRVTITAFGRWRYPVTWVFDDD